MTNSLPTRSILGLALSLCLSLPLPGAASDLAVLVGKASSTFEQVLQGVETLPGVKVHRFDLHEGLTRVDEARDRLRRYPFAGILVLGDSAEEFVSGLRLSTPWRPMLPLNEVPAAYWAELMVKLLPGQQTLHTLTPTPTPAYLEELDAALRVAGRKLKLHPFPAEGDPVGALDGALKQDSAFFLWAAPELLKRKALLEVLKLSHDRKVALLAFSRVLVDAGALAALEEDPASLGARSAALTLERTPPPPEVKLQLNEKRAAFLGVTPPAGMEIGGPFRLP